MISVRVHKDKKVDFTLSERFHKDAIRDALFDGGQIVVNRDVQLIRSGPKTGRKYFFRGQSYQASAPGEAPANRTGRLASSAGYKVHGYDELTVGEEAPYAKFLEDGTRNMKMRPHLVRAIRETQGDFVELFYNKVRRASK